MESEMNNGTDGTMENGSLVVCNIDIAYQGVLF